MTSARHLESIIDADPGLAYGTEVTHWRCRRVSAARGRALLEWGQVREWSIDTLSRVAIEGRWGPGDYVVEYVRVDEDGARDIRGRSEVLTFDPPPPAAAETISSSAARALHALRRLDHEQAAHAAHMRLLEHKAIIAMIEIERQRMFLAHSLEREKLATRERIARIEAEAPKLLEVRFSDLLHPRAPKPSGSKPN
jgi:hypothetical protein